MNEPTRQTIHIRIKDLRRERSLTQEELAEALGLSRQSINAMEAGRCLPSLPVAFQLASFFSVPLPEVFTLPESIFPTTNSIIKEEAMASLTPWSPLREMREALDDLMDESVNWAGPAQMTAPSANVAQTTHDVLVEMRLPGISKENLSIEVGDDFMTVSAEVHQEDESGDRQYFRREFAQQSFSRSIALPAIVHGEKAEAEMKQGILHVRIPKVIEEKPKTTRVNIKSAD